MVHVCQRYKINKCDSNITVLISVNKGFVQSSILTKVAPSLSGSTSDLTSDDTSDTTSIYSASMDDMDSSFFESQQQYPEVTTIESGDVLPSYYDAHLLHEVRYAIDW